MPLHRDPPNFLQVDTNQELKIINSDTGEVKFARNLAADFPDLESVRKVAVSREFIFLVVDHGEDSMALAYDLIRDKKTGASMICAGKLLPAKDVVDILVSYDQDRTESVFLLDTHSLRLVRSPKDGKGLELRRVISLEAELTNMVTRYSSSSGC